MPLLPLAGWAGTLEEGGGLEDGRGAERCLSLLWKLPFPGRQDSGVPQLKACACLSKDTMWCL